jgi:hypothetical protein
MFFVALYKISKLWNLHRCPSTDRWTEENVVYMFNGIILSHK